MTRPLINPHNLPRTMWVLNGETRVMMKEKRPVPRPVSPVSGGSMLSSTRSTKGNHHSVIAHYCYCCPQA